MIAKSFLRKPYNFFIFAGEIVTEKPCKTEAILLGMGRGNLHNRMEKYMGA
jgi:hypothetical protein